MKRLIIIIFPLLLSSCISKHEENTEEDVSKYIMFEAQKQKVNFSEIFNPEFEIIKLESKAGSLFDLPGKTVMTDSLIFIFDPALKRLLVFNRDGTFHNELDKKGRGPHEFLSIFDFTLDQDNKLIYIADDFNQKIFCYDFKFNLISKHDFPFYFFKFDLLENNNFLFYTGSIPVQKPEHQFSFILTNSKYRIIDKVLPYQFTLAPFGSRNKIFKLNNSKGHYFYANYSNKIFHINGDSIQPRYTILNFNGFELPPDNFYIKREEMGKRSAEVYDEVWNSNYILGYYFFEIDNHLLIFLTSSGKDFASYLNTENGNQWHAGELIDDYGLFLDGKFSRPSFIYGNKLGYYLAPFLALKEMENNPQRKLNPILGELKEEQNLILVLFTFK